jgi:hypothetical protein
VCDKLKISSKHFVHFGRAVGSVTAEFEELDSWLIKIIGNWNPDTQEDRYSAKLPLKGLRVMAGHSINKGQFFLPRSGVEVPETISKQIFKFVDRKILLTK